MYLPDRYKPALRVIVWVGFALCLAVTAVGLWLLRGSPYTGMRLYPCGEHTCLREVEDGSPAEAAGLLADDRILAVGGRPLSAAAFAPSADYLHRLVDRRHFWEDAAALSRAVLAEQPAEVVFEREGARGTTSLTPGLFPWHAILCRTFPLLFAAWFYGAVCLLVVRKRRVEMSLALVKMGLFGCAAFAATAIIRARDLSFPLGALRFLDAAVSFSGALSFTALLHLSLIVPVRRPLLDRRPWLIPALYGICGSLALLQFASFLESVAVAARFAMAASFPVLAATFSVLGVVTERNLVRRKQAQWAVAGMALGASLWLLLVILPLTLGATYIPEWTSALVAVPIPLGFAMAATRYRLMDIDSLSDAALTYGGTLVLLETVELGLLALLAPHLFARGFPTGGLLMLLVAIMLYAPLRDAIRRWVERLFKRGTYHTAAEIERFVMGMDPEISPLDRFAGFVERLLGPSGLLVIRRGEQGEASVALVKGRDAHACAEQALAVADSWDRLLGKHGERYGFELADRGVRVPGASPLEASLFVPFPSPALPAHCAVLLPKLDGRAYSAKDTALLNALAAATAQALEAREARLAKLRAEEEHLRQREHLIKEMHDGLGNILTNVSVAARMAGQLRDTDPARSQEMLQTISFLSGEALEFMRSTLFLLEAPEGELGPLLGAVRHRTGRLFAALGTELRFEVEPVVARLVADAAARSCLVRCLQEALSNITRHAEARHVSVEIRLDGDRVRMEISDDGKGFDPALAWNLGRGLSHLSARARDAGGEAVVESSPGAGTRVSLWVPIPCRKSPGEAA